MSDKTTSQEEMELNRTQESDLMCQAENPSEL